MSGPPKYPISSIQFWGGLLKLLSIRCMHEPKGKTQHFQIMPPALQQREKAAMLSLGTDLELMLTGR